MNRTLEKFTSGALQRKKKALTFYFAMEMGLVSFWAVIQSLMVAKAFSGLICQNMVQAVVF